jgi:hypothetical protein
MELRVGRNYYCRPIALLLVGFVALLSAFLATSTARAESFAVTPGSFKPVYEQHCFDANYPDLPARAFHYYDSGSQSNKVQLIIPNTTTTRMIGSDLDHLDAGVCGSNTVFRTQINSDPLNHQPSQYRYYEFLASPYIFPTSGEIYALIHNEYHGAREGGAICPVTPPRTEPVDAWCWHGSITSALSSPTSPTDRDGAGYSYQEAPPNHMITTIPYQYQPNWGEAGYAAPTNIVLRTEGDDDVFYAMFAARGSPHGTVYLSDSPSAGFRDQQPGPCIMRASPIGPRANWRIWNGSDWVESVNPYQDPYSTKPDLIKKHLCQPLGVAITTRSLTYNTALNRYVLVGKGFADPAVPGDQTGTYYALSSDLIHWSARRRLDIESEALSHCPGGIEYQSVIDPSDSSPNFEHPDADFEVFFTCVPADTSSHDRDLAAVRVRVTDSTNPIGPRSTALNLAVGERKDINFEPFSTRFNREPLDPSFFLTDVGAAFDPSRGFGWVTENSALQDPTPSNSDDHLPLDMIPNAVERHKYLTGMWSRQADTFVAMHYPASNDPNGVYEHRAGAWEISVPDGRYLVLAMVGDTDYLSDPGAPSVHGLSVEGRTLVAQFTPTPDNTNAVGWAVVNVTDGRITVDAREGPDYPAHNTKINWLELNRQG